MPRSCQKEKGFDLGYNNNCGCLNCFHNFDGILGRVLCLLVYRDRRVFRVFIVYQIVDIYKNYKG